MTQEYPYRVCRDEVANEDSSIQCDLCDRWSHIDCIGISIRKYEKLKSDSSPWYCPIYLSEFPFFQMNDKELKTFLKKSKTSATPIQVTSKEFRTKELIKSFKQLKQIFEESENSVSCDYYSVHDLSKIQIHQHDLSIIHLKISFLASHIHELKLFLSLLKVSFDIICISESRISKHNLPTININIPGYNIEHTPTESKAGGTLMYISEKVSYKIRSDLNIYNPKQLESIFIETLRPDLPGGIVGTIYKHPSMNVSAFNSEFFAPLLKNLNKENKEVILTGDFNVNLLNFGKKRGTH